MRVGPIGARVEGHNKTADPLRGRRRVSVVVSLLEASRVDATSSTKCLPGNCLLCNAGNSSNGRDLQR